MNLFGNKGDNAMAAAVEAANQAEEAMEQQAMSSVSHTTWVTP